MSRSLRLSPLITVDALDAEEVAEIPCGTYVLARTISSVWCQAALMRHRVEKGWHQVYITHEWIRGGWVKLDSARTMDVLSEVIVAYYYSSTAAKIYAFLNNPYLRGL